MSQRLNFEFFLTIREFSLLLVVQWYLRQWCEAFRHTLSIMTQKVKLKITQMYSSISLILYFIINLWSDHAHIHTRGGSESPNLFLLNKKLIFDPADIDLRFFASFYDKKHSAIVIRMRQYYCPFLPNIVWSTGWSIRKLRKNLLLKKLSHAFKKLLRPSHFS